MIFEDFDLEKISGKKEYQNRITIQIGDIQIHEKLSEKEQKKMLKMMEQDLHHTPKIKKSLNQINVNSKLAHKTKRPRMKTIHDLAPLNFENADIIKTA